MITRLQSARRSKAGQQDSLMGSIVLQRKFQKCDKKKRALQRAAFHPAPYSVPPVTHEVLRSPGQPLDPAMRSFMEPRFGHDFIRVKIYSDPGLVGALPAHLLRFGGRPEANLRTGHNQVSVNGPAGNTAPNQSSTTPAPRQQSSRAGSNDSCPNDIRVVGVGQGNDRDFGRTGPITGWGGFAQMEVSDQSGRTWDGAVIGETLINIRNTCGNEGNNACSNRSGQGGGTGSVFEVGKESNFLGLAPLPANRNRFYDLHVFMKKGSSLLHLLNQPSCEIQCKQFYSCANRRLSPDFIITYSMTRDAVPRTEGGYNALTRVEVRKAANTAPRASPTAPSG